MKKYVLLVVMLFAIAPVATALAIQALPSPVPPTDQELFEMRLGKYSTTVFQKNKHPCVCQEAPNVGRAGVIRRAFTNSSFNIACVILLFNQSGNEFGETACSRFVPLTR